MARLRYLIAPSNLGNGPGWNHGSAATSSPNAKPAHAPIAEETTKIFESEEAPQIFETSEEEVISPANEKSQKKYIPPKTKKHLSPAVRKIVEEKKIDLSNKPDLPNVWPT